MVEEGGYPGEMVGRIRSRRLFKRAVYVGLDSLEYPMPANGRERRIALEIAEIASVDPDYVLVDMPQLPQAPEGDFPALVNGVVRSLREVSPLAAILEKANRANWRIGVYCRQEDRDRVAQAARKCLNLRKNKLVYRYIDSFDQ
jgi:HD superfamily phosphohydrolase